MSTIHPTHEKTLDTDHRDCFEPMASREQLLGMLEAMRVLQLAIVLQPLS